MRRSTITVGREIELNERFKVVFDADLMGQKTLFNAEPKEG